MTYKIVIIDTEEDLNDMRPNNVYIGDQEVTLGEEGVTSPSDDWVMRMAVIQPGQGVLAKSIITIDKVAEALVAWNMSNWKMKEVCGEGFDIDKPLLRAQLNSKIKSLKAELEDLMLQVKEMDNASL